MCLGNFHPSVRKHVISADAEYATNNASGPISKGGVEPKFPRHSRIVFTCRRVSSSTYATMHSTLGRSPSAISYSKSQTLIVVKLLMSTAASRQSGAATQDGPRGQSCDRRRFSQSAVQEFVSAILVRQRHRHRGRRQPCSLRRLLRVDWSR